MAHEEATGRSSGPGRGSTGAVDEAELARFAAIADEWWDPDGKFAPLHRMNPVRLGYVRDRICDRYSRNPRETRALDGLSVLDVGCGGGLICEPLARQGADVTGIDPSERTIAVAETHAQRSGLEIAYEATTVETLAAAGRQFDIVLALEVVEHVPNVPQFISAISSLIKPGGVFVGSTINRTPKAYALAIFGAEHVLRWLPKGTHTYSKFVTPAEFRSALAGSCLEVDDTTGMAYNPLMNRWRLSRDCDVNYLISASQNEI